MLVDILDACTVQLVEETKVKKREDWNQEIHLRRWPSDSNRIRNLQAPCACTSQHAMGPPFCKPAFKPLFFVPSLLFFIGTLSWICLSVCNIYILYIYINAQFFNLHPFTYTVYKYVHSFNRFIRSFPCTAPPKWLQDCKLTMPCVLLNMDYMILGYRFFLVPYRLCRFRDFPQSSRQLLTTLIIH